MCGLLINVSFQEKKKGRKSKKSEGKRTSELQHGSVPNKKKKNGKLYKKEYMKLNSELLQTTYKNCIMIYNINLKANLYAYKVVKYKMANPEGFPFLLTF